MADDPGEVSLFHLLESGYGIQQWMRLADARWYQASVQMDLLGARILEIQWGGRLRGDASHKRYILDDLTTQDLRRLAKRITRRRRAHGYVMQNAGRR